MLRGALKRIVFLRSAYHLFLTLPIFIQDEERSYTVFQRLFASQSDPWNYNDSANRERFLLLSQMLDRVRGESKFRRAVEIGCAEGVFTELLAPRCESLLALDFAPLALERARKRSSETPHLRFESFDLRRDRLSGPFDLIVVTDVLGCIHRPSVMRAVRSKIVDALDPGGFLLFGDVRQSEAIECAWWSEPLVRGGTRILQFLARHQSLALVESADTKTHVFALLRKISYSRPGQTNT